MKAIIVLYCEGRIDDSFIFCSGVENIILDLETIKYNSNYIEVIKYLDKVSGIFDNICFNINIITNTLYKLYNFGVLEEKLYIRLVDFYKFHGKCGIALMAKAKE